MPDHLDTHQVGAATLLLGDAIARMAELPDASVDLVLTDVPYCSGATREAGRTRPGKVMTRGKADDGRWFGSDSLSTRGFVFLLRSCALEWQRLLKPGGHALVFIDWRMEDVCAEAVESEYLRGKAEVADAIESADLRRAGMVVWDKTHFGMGSHFRLQFELVLHFTKGVGTPPLRRDVGNVIRCKPVSFKRHPCEKPDELLGTLIETLCPIGGTVLDSFAGVCPAVTAAVKRGRRAVGIEREQRFLEVGLRDLVELHDLAA